jgi:hypothetical protein
MTTENQTKPKLTLDEKTKRILNNSETMETIFLNIAAGGSLINLCRMWEVRYCDIIRWVIADTQRETLYNKALFARNEWAFHPIQRLIGIFNDYEMLMDKMKIFHNEHLYGSMSKKDQPDLTKAEI